MSIHSVKQKIQKLRDELNHHNYLYYVRDQPKISDFEFDALMNDLITLESKYPDFFDSLSPTQRVGGGLLEGFTTIKHNYPMLSLSNTYSRKDLVEFDKRVKKILNSDLVNYTCELKYDGVAISLLYENGLLIRGVTRGDGVYGDDVTENIKKIKSIPLKLFGDFPSYLEVRGEVFINKNEFIKINNERASKRLILEKEYHKYQKKQASLDFDKKQKYYLSEIKKLAPYSNTRNFASGSLKLLDSSKVAKRNLDCVIYSTHSNTLPHDQHSQNLLKAQDWGFKTSKYIQMCKNIDEMMNFINKIEFERKSLLFDIDGVVIKVDSIASQDTLSHTSKSPRWAISYKFKSAQSVTVLHNVVYQIGRTGSVTPVAELSPVQLAGSLIKRATLHNADFIKKLDLKIGDTVIIEKGGDVIPKVVSVNQEKRTLLCRDIVFLSHCPSCNSTLTKITNEANHYCLNSDNCMPQKIAKLEHFIGRDALNIHTLGSQTIKLLFQKSIITGIFDLYDLNVSKLSHLKGFGEKSKSIKKAQNIIDSLEDSKKVSFEKVLYGLGIRHVGKTVSKKLAEHFLSIDTLINNKYEDFIALDEIGEKIASSLSDYFQNEKNRLLIKKLQDYGLQFQTNTKRLKSDKLNNLTFVVSGIFTLSRSELKDMIEDHGGKNSTALSKKTNYLISGDNMGAKKREKAIVLNVPIISELEFKRMLE
tara:strand:- start:869 stop:2977 length:2109 start_codon:yes stop_codon:yes gene_type:complete